MSVEEEAKRSEEEKRAIGAVSFYSLEITVLRSDMGYRASITWRWKRRHLRENIVVCPGF